MIGEGGMIGEGVGHCYVGCATDRRYVPLTCVMLSSLDDNGSIPEARLLVAGFGLTADDEDDIRRSAGRLGERAEFVALDRDSPDFVALPPFDCPLPLLARFVLPGKVWERHARLIMLDADMIVNRSLRPLFETNMRGVAIAAVHDSISWREHYGRPPHPHYFNAGMMMVDVDRFNAEEIGRRAMERLAAYDHKPMWLDQDAINDVVGDRWLPLDRRWNFFHAGDYRAFTLQDYEAADIVHYSGPKLWDDPSHPGASIFFRHAERMERKIGRQAPVGAAGLTRDYAAASYEVLLGREMEAVSIFHDRAHMTIPEFVGTIIGSDEFRARVLKPIRNGRPLRTHPAGRGPTLRQRLWAADQLPVLERSAAAIERAASWQDLLGVLVRDGRLMATARLEPV